MEPACQTTLNDLQSTAAKSLSQATAMPKGMYVSPEILALESERIFERGWLCAGRTDELPNIGD